MLNYLGKWTKTKKNDEPDARSSSLFDVATVIIFRT